MTARMVRAEGAALGNSTLPMLSIEQFLLAFVARERVEPRYAPVGGGNVKDLHDRESADARAEGPAVGQFERATIELP